MTFFADIRSYNYQKDAEVTKIGTVYADLLFLVNFSMDMLCLILVAKLTSKRLSLLRAALGAALGGIYSVVILFISLSPPLALLLHLTCCVAMCAASFGVRGGAKQVLLNTAAFLVSSSLLGGIMTAAFSLLNTLGISTENAGENDIPPWLILTFGAISAFLAKVGGRHLKKKASLRFAEVEITLGDKTLAVSAVCDSGNLLRDSISGRTVMVADTRHAEYFFGNKKEITPLDLPRLAPELGRRSSLIPYRTASGSKTMVAFRPQKLIIKSEGCEHEADALVGFASIENIPNGCSALIPPDLL